MVDTPPNPYGTCFDATAHNLITNFDEEIWVCHGVGIANRPGQEGMKIAHAWLEFEREGHVIAFDCIWLMFQKAGTYRERLQLSYAVKYSKQEFIRLWNQYGFPGPWDEQIKPYTSDSHSVPLK